MNNYTSRKSRKSRKSKKTMSRNKLSVPQLSRPTNISENIFETIIKNIKEETFTAVSDEYDFEDTSELIAEESSYKEKLHQQDDNISNVVAPLTKCQNNEESMDQIDSNIPESNLPVIKM